MSTSFDKFIAMLGDPCVSKQHRYCSLIDVLVDAREGVERAQQTADAVLGKLENETAESRYKTMAKQLKKIMDELAQVPMKPATLLQVAKGPGPSCLVASSDHEMARVAPGSVELLNELKPGDAVLVDLKNMVLFDRIEDPVRFGNIKVLERQVDEGHVEIKNYQDERSVVLVTEDIARDIKKGLVKPGDQVLTDASGMVVVYAIPRPENDLDRFRFLDRGQVPDVVVERDIGSPHRVISEVARHIREEMTRPDLRRHFKLRPCITRLLCGVSGSGKTLAVQAIHRLMYDIMAEVTGVPVPELPPRVFRFRNSQVLSMWLGESDKNADRLFDEVEEAAARKFTGKKGAQFSLPVLVVMEEADGVGRARGSEAIYDRILTTILQRLDPNRPGLSDRLVVFLSTTNEHHIVDPAFLRRIGGSVERFGRLNRESFTQVLRKHVDGLPSKHDWDKAVSHVAGALFDPLAVEDPGVVEIHYHGGRGREIKYASDFLTGALVDRAVQQAASKAWEESLDKDRCSFVTPSRIVESIRSQVQSVAEQLSPENASHYLDLPDGASVSRVGTLNANPKS